MSEEAPVGLTPDEDWLANLTDEEVELLLGSMTYQEWLDVMTPIWQAQLHCNDNLLRPQ